MRFQKKYKLLSKFRSDKTSLKFALRVLRFKRPKWFKFQKQLLAFAGKNIEFHNYEIQWLKVKTWARIQSSYLEYIELNRYHNSFFEQRKNSNISKNYLRREFILFKFIQNYFHLDIFLWNLGFFPSSYACHSAVLNDKIILNGKKCGTSICLFKGDIIEFSSCNNLNIESYFSTQSEHNVFHTFAEVDYYTKTVVVVKDLSTLSYEDLIWLLPDYVDLTKIER